MHNTSMWNRLFLLFLLMMSSSSFSATVDELESEVNRFVQNLNSRFDFEVKVRKVTTCGFSAHQNEMNQFEIQFCLSDLKYFSDLPNSQNPSTSLLTIIAHEYAHFFLDFDYSEEAMTEIDASLNRIAKDILNSIRSEESKLEKLKKIYLTIADDSEDQISEDDQYLEAIYHLLLLGSHENTDSLSIKLMHLENLTTDPDVMRHLPALTGTSGQIVEDMIRARTIVLKTSEKESLLGWSNYQCISQGLERSDYSPALKKTLAESGHISLLTPFNQPCTDEQIVRTFFRIMDSYY